MDFPKKAIDTDDLNLFAGNVVYYTKIISLMKILREIDYRGFKEYSENCLLAQKPANKNEEETVAHLKRVIDSLPYLIKALHIYEGVESPQAGVDRAQNN